MLFSMHYFLVSIIYKKTCFHINMTIGACKYDNIIDKNLLDWAYSKKYFFLL